MSGQGLIQVRVDNDLKKDVSEIYEMLGLDLPTAIRMFLVKSKQVRGIPFETTLPENVVTHSDALVAFYNIRQQLSDVPEMTLEEINDEIQQIREERKVGKK